MRAAVDAVEEAEGAVGVLVNNAGYSQSGAIETRPDGAACARQFETNVFGLVRLCQLVLPGMRAQRWGKIVNLSSMGGRLVFPGGGFYHATKYAVEAISDALRFEVEGFGDRRGPDRAGPDPDRRSARPRVRRGEASPDDGPYARLQRRASRRPPRASTRTARSVAASAAAGGGREGDREGARPRDRPRARYRSRRRRSC